MSRNRPKFGVPLPVAGSHPVVAFHPFVPHPNQKVQTHQMTTIILKESCRTWIGPCGDVVQARFAERVYEWIPVRAHEIRTLKALVRRSVDALTGNQEVDGLAALGRHSIEPPKEGYHQNLIATL